MAEGLRELAFDPEPSPRRLTNDDVRDGRSGSPRIGADCEIGDPGSTPMVVRGFWADGVGALYMYVAARTIDEPTQNASEMG